MLDNSSKNVLDAYYEAKRGQETARFMIPFTWFLALLVIAIFGHFWYKSNKKHVADKKHLVSSLRTVKILKENSEKELALTLADLEEAKYEQDLLAERNKSLMVKNTKLAKDNRRYKTKVARFVKLEEEYVALSQELNEINTQKKRLIQEVDYLEGYRKHYFEQSEPGQGVPIFISQLPSNIDQKWNLSLIGPHLLPNLTPAVHEQLRPSKSNQDKEDKTYNLGIFGGSNHYFGLYLLGAFTLFLTIINWMNPDILSKHFQKYIKSH